MEETEHASAAFGECLSNDRCCRHDAFDVAESMLSASYSSDRNAHLIVSGRFDIDLPEPILARGDVHAIFAVDKVHFSTGREPETVEVLISTDQFAWRDTGKSRDVVRRDLMSDHYDDVAPLIIEAHELVMRRHEGMIDLGTYRRRTENIDARFAKLGVGGPLWDWQTVSAEISGLVPHEVRSRRVPGANNASALAIADLVPPVMSIRLDLDIPETSCVGFAGPIDPLEIGELYLIVFRRIVDAGAHRYLFPASPAGSVFSGPETDDLEEAIAFVAGCLGWDEINTGPPAQIRGRALSVCKTVARAWLDGDHEWAVKRNHHRWRRLEAVHPAFAKLRRDGPLLE